MSRYSGTVTIVDDEGNAVFERELNEDEIIEALLAATPDSTETVEEEVGAEEDFAPKSTGRTIAVGQKPCCGSKQRRHRKNCPEADAGMSTKPSRKPFTEPTYNVVKTMLEDGYGSPEDIAEKKGLDVEEVRRVNLSDDYADYLEIA